MERPDFTPRNIAKVVVSASISHKTGKIAKNLLTDYTSLPQGGTTANVAGMLIGWAIADTIKPVSDSMVDKAADLIVAKRAERAERKAQKEALKNEEE